MKENEVIIDDINEIIETANKNSLKINLAVIASVKNKTANYNDYKEHSVSTSYLSLANLDEIIGYFQTSGFFTSVYFDIEDFLAKFYGEDLTTKPNIILETSPKGTGRGKDALIPCLCDIWNIMHLGPTANTNCLCSSKYQWTSILKAHGIPTPASFFYSKGFGSDIPLKGVKYILKLNYECASIGLSDNSVILNDGNNISTYADDLSKKYVQPIIVQEFISGYEVEVPVLINCNKTIVFPPVGLSFNGKKLFEKEFLNYDIIYDDNYGFYDFAKVEPHTAEKLKECVKNIVRVLDLNGYMRIDFRVTENGEIFVIDINNDPCIDINGSFIYSLKTLGFKNETIAPLLIGNCLYNRKGDLNQQQIKNYSLQN